MIHRRYLAVALLGLILAGCSTKPATSSPKPTSYGTCTPDRATPSRNSLNDDFATAEGLQSPSITITPWTSATPANYGYTHQRPDGNRLVPGKGQIPTLDPLDIPLPGPAAWVAAIPWETGSFWIVTLSDGQVLGFHVAAEGWKSAAIHFNKQAAGQPPLLQGNGSEPTLLLAPSKLASPLTHAIPDRGLYYAQIFIEPTGDLIRVNHNLSLTPALRVNALPDARILSDEQGRLLLLTGSTNQYEHGVLGDTLEASSITLVQNASQGEYYTIAMPIGLVIEGISPIWTDLNGDGEREIIVTASNIQLGAQILVFNEAGKQIAAGPAIGQGFRWRHQIAAAPFGPNGEMELVDVLTPHLGGVVEYYRWEADQLKIIAQLPGYTSHILGSRNLDMAAAGDFDGDRSIELLLPRQDRKELAAIRRTPDGAEEVWSLSLDGMLITNIGAVTLADGSIAIGVGQVNDILLSSGYSLRIWHP